ncbi:hypothetical protein Tco_0703241 [Tanacetum coccineum]|uniref:Uncharacterized protein n=1 Tax=Tanacetum coccineum TaxID=301880 RepID=A0ABQ4XZA0_9ASTR
MQNGIAIHMLTEKKYPLSQEMISEMLNKRLEIDHESTQAYELLKFIRSQGRIVGNKSSSRVNTAKSEEAPDLLAGQTEFLTPHELQELPEQLADQFELGQEEEELAALGPRSDHVTRFKSTKKERAKIDIDLTYEKIRHGLERP